MAFTQETFAPVSTRASLTPGIWTYFTNDDFVEVFGTGYFNDKIFQLEPGDLIYITIGGEAGYTARVDIDSTGIVLISRNLVLSAFSTAANQQPTGLDTPLQIEFGAAQDPENGPISLDANGNFTVKRTGRFVVESQLQIGRTGAAQVSFIFVRFTVDGNQAGPTLFTKLENAEVSESFQLGFTRAYATGEVLRVEIYRDSSGNNSGGLFQQTSTLGWTTVPTAAVTIFEDG